MNNPYQIKDGFIREPGDWRIQAACRGTDEPDLWFPAYSEERNLKTKTALSLCASCPSLLSCRAWALNNREEHGIYGGLTPSERRQILRRHT